MNEVREKLVELIRQIVIPFWAGQIADHLISNDVVPVVRCKDCKRTVQTKWGLVCGHSRPSKSLDQYFLMGTDIVALVEPDDFCSYGERREGDGR